jgi:hypothetical protein
MSAARLAGGLDYALTDKVSVGVEYRYFDLGKQTYNLGAVTGTAAAGALTSEAGRRSSPDNQIVSWHKHWTGHRVRDAKIGAGYQIATVRIFLICLRRTVVAKPRASFSQVLPVPRRAASSLRWSSCEVPKTSCDARPDHTTGRIRLWRPHRAAGGLSQYSFRLGRMPRTAAFGHLSIFRAYVLWARSRLSATGLRAVLIQPRAHDGAAAA